MSTDQNKTAHIAPASDSEAQSRSKKLLAEGALIGWIALCIILLLALLTYSSEDPGWSHTGSRADVANLIGPVGAWLSDVFFSLFGGMAYLFPLLLAIRAMQILRTHFLSEREDFDSVSFILRVIGFSLVMISATSLANIQYLDNLAYYPFGSGGILGSKIGEAVIAAFS